jgi:hypothetical protein
MAATTKCETITRMQRDSRRVSLVSRRNGRRKQLGCDAERLIQRLETAFFKIRFPIDMQDF